MSDITAHGWTVDKHGVIAYSEDLWLEWDDIAAPSDVPDVHRRDSYSALVACVRDAATLRAARELVEGVRERHPLQYAYRYGIGPPVMHTENDHDPNIRERYNRCPACEEWSPCSVRKLLDLLVPAGDTEARRGTHQPGEPCDCGLSGCWWNDHGPDEVSS